MKKVLLLLLSVLFCNVSYGQSLFVEEFNYTAGDLLTAHSWVQSGTSATNPLAVTTPGLTYTNYPSVAGNACTLAAIGQDVYRSYTAVSSGNLYLSFLINVQSAGTGDYFIALSTSSGQLNYYCRVHIKSNGSGYSLGLSKSNEVNGGSIYGGTVFNFNAAYLVVCKHTFVATATTDDIESIFVFSSPTIPVAEPLTPEVGPYTNATKNDPADLGYVTIRQGSTGASALLTIDGIRLNTSWSGLLGIASLVAPVATAASNITVTGFTANWNSVNTATDYWLDVSTASDFSTFVANYNMKEVGNVTSYKVDSVSSGTVYYYRVRASNSGGQSANSNTISVTTLLAAPVATAATNITTTGFTANWNASNGSTNYWIDISTTDDFSNVLTSYNNKSVGNVTTFNLTSLTPNTTYYFRVCASNIHGTSPYSNTITVVTKVTGIDNNLTTVPNRFDLFQNYPNPFNPSTVISWQIAISSFVTLKIYDLLGREAATLVNEFQQAGIHNCEFRVQNGELASGIYYYHLITEKFSQIKKMLLIK